MGRDTQTEARYHFLDWPPFRDDGARMPAEERDDALLAQGGMGRIFVALDEPIGRVVALKESLEEPGRDDDAGDSDPDSLRARFLREARITGQLEHPGIVPVYELGQQPDGTPYYTMKLVKGQTLRRALAACAGLRERLGLLSKLADICHAVAYAHSRGVIHRDLKPDNVMVGAFGETVVLDWGLARPVREPDQDPEQPPGSVQPGDSWKTQGSFQGTPAYMAPEQARGDGTPVDELSDLWSLGALLYEVLTGLPPAPTEGSAQTLAWLLDPEAAIVPVRERCPEAPRELASLAMACLQRDRGARLPSAQLMARDIERYQAGERVVSHNYSSVDLARHLLERNRASSVSVAVALLIAGVAGVLGWSSWRAHARAERLAANSAQEQLMLAREALDAGRPLEAQARIRAALEHQDSPLGRTLWMEVQRAPLLWSSDRGREVTGLDFSPDAQTLAIASVAPSLSLVDPFTREERSLEGPGENLYVVRYAPDGSRLVAGGARGLLAVWDGEAEAAWSLSSGQETISSLSFDSAGSRLLAGDFGGSIGLWDLEQRALVRRFEGHNGGVAGLAWSSDGSGFFSGGEDGILRYWDIDSGEPRTVGAGEDPQELTGLAFTPDGEGLLVSSFDGSLRLLDPASGAVLRTVHEGGAGITVMAYDPETGRAAWGTLDGEVGVSTHGGQEPPDTLAAHRTLVFAVALGDGDLLATGGLDRHVRLSNLALTQPPLPAGSHEGVVSSVDSSPDGSEFVSGGWDGTIRIWESATGRQRAVIYGHDDHVTRVRYAPDGTQITSAGADGTIRSWDAQSGALEAVMLGHGDAIAGLEYAADGSLLVSSSHDESVRLWDPATGQAQRPLWTQGRPSAALSPDGEQLVIAGGIGEPVIEQIPLDDRERKTTLPASSDVLVDLVYSPNGDRLYGLTRSCEVVSQELGGEAWEVLDRCEGTGRSIHLAAGRLAVGSSAPELLVLDLDTGARLDTIDHGGPTAAVRLDSSGQTLVSAGYDGTVRSWDAVSGEARWGSGQRARPLDDLADGSLQDQPPSRQTSLAAGPPGSVLAGFEDGTVGLWDEETQRRLLSFRLHGAIVELALEGQEITASSELGDQARVDVSALLMDRCSLLLQIQQTIPVWWEDGELVHAGGTLAPDCSGK